MHGRKSRGGGGGGGGDPPPRFWRWGTQYQMSPPPHVFVVGQFFCWKNRIFNKICLTFFLLVGVGPTGTPNLSLKNCQRRWRCGKKKFRSPPPPLPPRSSAFLGVARLWAGGGEKTILCPPHYPLRISALGSMLIDVKLVVTILLSFDL